MAAEWTTGKRTMTNKRTLTSAANKFIFCQAQAALLLAAGADLLLLARAQMDVQRADDQQQQATNEQASNLTTNNISTAATLTPDYENLSFPFYTRLLATAACLIILTVGVCGNLLVPLVVIKTKYLRNSTNLFLINLSIADLLVLIVCMPTVLIELHSRPETWLLGEPMCKLTNFVETFAANGSILTILAISFERYYAICKPLKAGYKCTRLRAGVIIGIIWLLSFILSAPVLIMAQSSQTPYIDGSMVNNCILETDTYWPKMYVFVSMVAFFCLPLLVLMLVYWLISRRLIRENLTLMTPAASVSTCRRHGANGSAANHHRSHCVHGNELPSYSSANEHSSTGTLSSRYHFFTKHPACSRTTSVPSSSSGGSTAAPLLKQRASKARMLTLSEQNAMASRTQTMSHSWAARILPVSLIYLFTEHSNKNDHQTANQPTTQADEGQLREHLNNLIPNHELEAEHGSKSGRNRQRSCLAKTKAFSVDQNHYYFSPVASGRHGADGTSRQGSSMPNRRQEFNGLLTSTSSAPDDSMPCGCSHTSGHPSVASFLSLFTRAKLNQIKENWLNLIPLASRAPKPHPDDHQNCARKLADESAASAAGCHAKSKTATNEADDDSANKEEDGDDEYYDGEKLISSCDKTAAAATTNKSDRIMINNQIRPAESLAQNKCTALTSSGGDDRHINDQSANARAQAYPPPLSPKMAAHSSDSANMEASGPSGTEMDDGQQTQRLHSLSHTPTEGPLPSHSSASSSSCSSAANRRDRHVSRCRISLATSKKAKQHHHHRHYNEQHLQQQQPEQLAQQDWNTNELMTRKRSKFRWFKGYSVSSSGSSSTGGRTLSSALPSSASTGDLGGSSSAIAVELSVASNHEPNGAVIKSANPFNHSHAGSNVANDTDHQQQQPARQTKSILHYVPSQTLRSSLSGVRRQSDRSQCRPRHQSTRSERHERIRFAHFVDDPVSCTQSEINETLSSQPAAYATGTGGAAPVAMASAATVARDQMSPSPLSLNSNSNSSTNSNYRPSSDSPSLTCHMANYRDSSTSSPEDLRPSSSLSHEYGVEFSEMAGTESIDDHDEPVQIKQINGTCHASATNQPDASIATTLATQTADGYAGQTTATARRDPVIESLSSIDCNQTTQLTAGGQNCDNQVIALNAMLEGREKLCLSASCDHRSASRPTLSHDPDDAIRQTRAPAGECNKSVSLDDQQRNNQRANGYAGDIIKEEENSLESRPIATNLMTIAHNFYAKHSKRRADSQPIVPTVQFNHHSNSANNSDTRKDHACRTLASEFLVIRDISKKQQMDSRRQVVIMLAFVVACFFLLFFPYRVFTIWLILSTEDQVRALGMEAYYNISYFSRILIYLHSAINPIAYNLISTKFRRAFISILLCRGPANRRQFINDHHHHKHLRHKQSANLSYQSQQSNNQSRNNY